MCNEAPLSTMYFLSLECIAMPVVVFFAISDVIRENIGRDRAPRWRWISDVVATLRVARLTLQTRTLWSVSWPTVTRVTLACVSFHFYLFPFFSQSQKIEKRRKVQPREKQNKTWKSQKKKKTRKNQKKRPPLSLSHPPLLRDRSNKGFFFFRNGKRNRAAIEAEKSGKQLNPGPRRSHSALQASYL